jgi:heme/copper-type cytochrome/quinol oxidase subunit 4
MGGLSTGELIGIIIPIAAIQLGLMIWAFVDLVKRDVVKGGSKLVWALIILVVNLVGPIVYLMWGRNE